MAEIKVKRLHKLESDGPTKAFVDISIDDEIVVTGLRVVMKKDNELFVSMPQDVGKDGKWYNTVLLTNKDVKSRLSSIVLEAYGVADNTKNNSQL